MLEVAERAAWACPPSAVEVVTPPTASTVIRLADLRAHVAQSLLDDDMLLQQIEAAVQEIVASRLQRPLLAQTRRAWFDRLPGSVVRLSEPASAITKVTVYSKADVATEVSPTVYQTDVASAPARLCVRDGQTWPTDLRLRHAVAVEYETGWTTESMPGAVRLAIALLVAHFYEYRGVVTAGGGLTPVPYGIEALLAPHALALGVA